MTPEGLPITEDVNFRVSPDGAMIALDFLGRDGAVRSVAFPNADLTKLFAGFLWAGEECAKRQTLSRPDPDLREVLRRGAPVADDWLITDVGADQFLEVRIGAALLCVKLPDRAGGPRR